MLCYFMMFYLFIGNKPNNNILRNKMLCKGIMNLVNNDENFEEEEFNEAFNKSFNDNMKTEQEQEQEQSFLKAIMEERFLRHRGCFSGNDERLFKKNGKDGKLISLLFSMKIKRENTCNYLENKQKLELINTLKSPVVSINTKMELIPVEQSFVPDIYNAGLFKDWNLEI